MISPEEATSNRIYDGYADEYGFDVNSTLSARLKYELTVKYLQTDYEVLDVGCANGLHIQALAPSCKHIVGVDISMSMLGVANNSLIEKGIRNADLKLCSAASLDFSDASFDLVYSFSTLLLVPEVERAISEMVRVLRPGGFAILDITGCYNLSRIYWGLYYRRRGHFGVHSFSYPRIRSELNGLGLDIIESHALGFSDQWKYIPGLHLLKFLEVIFHGSRKRDLDYRISNLPLLFPLANRWYIACRKRSCA